MASKTSQSQIHARSLRFVPRDVEDSLVRHELFEKNTAWENFGR